MTHDSTLIRKSKVMHVRLSKDEYKALETRARQEMATISVVMRNAVVKYLEG